MFGICALRSKTFRAEGVKFFLHRSFSSSVLATKMASKGTDYSSWSSDSLVARVTALEQQLKDMNERLLNLWTCFGA